MIEILKVLFKYGASLFLETKGKNDLSPLEIVIKKNKKRFTVTEKYEETIKFLFQKGAKLYLNENGKTLEDLCLKNNRLKYLLLEAPLPQIDISPELVKKTKEIDLRNASMFFLPKSLSLFVNLENLYISDNNLSFLPPFLTHLKKLKWNYQQFSQGNTLSAVPPPVLGFISFFSFLTFVKIFFYRKT